MFGNLSGAILAGPRSLFALGRDGFLPRVLATVNPVRHTPSVAIVAYALVGLALGLSGTFEQIAILVNLASLSVYIVIALAAWRLRVLKVRLEGEPFNLPGGPLVPLLACAAIGAVIVATVSKAEVAALAMALAVASVVYGVRALRRSTFSPSPSSDAM